MNTEKKFNEPIIRIPSALAEENIYGFKRRTVFAPGVTGNHTVKFCSVTGHYGAASQSHIHPGDEIVFTLEGRNINFSGKHSCILEKNQGLAIPPCTEHTTRVIEAAPWQGISFYCDDCPLIQTDSCITSTAIQRSSLDIPLSPCAEHLRKQVLFSPQDRKTHFLELLAYGCDTPAAPTTLLHRGETVYYLLSGTLHLSWNQKKTVLSKGMAVIIPAGFLHRLGTENPQGCRVLAGSCSSCRILE